MSGAWFDQGVRRDAVARVVAGESASAVARDLGCCRGSVSLWCQEAGVELVGGRRGGTVQCDQARRAKVVQAVLAGATLTRAGAAAGVSRDSARRYWHDQAVESAATAPRRSSERSSGRRDWSVSACSGRVGRGQRVSDAERVLIAQGRARGESAAAIARSLGRCRQTVSREIARNTGPDGAYRAPGASMAAQERLARPKARRLDTDPVLRAEVVALLEDGASPRQISARLRWAHPDNESMRISHDMSRSTRPSTSRAPGACASSCGWTRPYAQDAPGACPAHHWPAWHVGPTAPGSREPRSVCARPRPLTGPYRATGRATWSSAPAGAAP